MNSYITNCLIAKRPEDTVLFFENDQSQMVARLDGYAIIPVDQYEAIKSLRAKLAEAEIDAARWKWLRKNWTTMSSDYRDGVIVFRLNQDKWAEFDGSVIDAATDAAMKEQP